MAALHKDKEQRKRDGKAALRRIAKRISLYDVKDIDVAKTVIMTAMSPAVRKLVEERHQWLREPAEAISRGKWCWAAACIDNNGDPSIAVTGLFRQIRSLSDLCQATGSPGWIRDLCAHGDVEANPGPAVPSTSASGAAGVPVPPAEPTEAELRAQHIHCDRPDVVMARVDRMGAIQLATTSRSRGRGIAMPLNGTGVYTNMHQPTTQYMLIGRLKDGAPDGSLSASPSPWNKKAITGPLVNAAGPHVYLIGEWYPAEDKGSLGGLHCRTWTPPKFAYVSKTGVCEGTAVEATAKGTEEARDWKTRPVIVPRIEQTAYGIDKTTAERLSLAPTPASTTCEANALKLGLMLD
ncbi:hypothetical protein MTO96_043525 [Rhipicephalus appendiculatus]